MRTRTAHGCATNPSVGLFAGESRSAPASWEARGTLDVAKILAGPPYTFTAVPRVESSNRLVDPSSPAFRNPPRVVTSRNALPARCLELPVDRHVGGEGPGRVGVGEIPSHRAFVGRTRSHSVPARLQNPPFLSTGRSAGRVSRRAADPAAYPFSARSQSVTRDHREGTERGRYFTPSGSLASDYRRPHNLGLRAAAGGAAPQPCRSGGDPNASRPNVTAEQPPNPKRFGWWND